MAIAFLFILVFSCWSVHSFYIGKRVEGRPVTLLSTPTRQQRDSGYVIFWDLDHTLYSQKTDIYARKLIVEYAVKKLGMERGQARQICDRLELEFDGQTLAGLTQNYDVDPVEFEAWIDKEACLYERLRPSKRLNSLLKNSKARNWIITNSGWGHASRVVDALGISSYIEGIVFLDYSNPNHVRKPSSEAFLNAMTYVDVIDPSRCILVDDHLVYVKGACEVGWNAVHYCEPKFCKVIHHRLFSRSTDSKCDRPRTITRLEDVHEILAKLQVVE